jgi:hypothetical protein
MRDEEFVRLTGNILKMEALTSTDKIVLGYNLTLPTFFASNAHVAASVGMKLKTVEKSITKLRKLGLWREPSSYPGRKEKRPAPTGVGTSSYSGRMPLPTRVGHKKSFSPLKTDPREERGEERLEEKKKKDGEESAAGAAALCHSAQTFSKILGEEDQLAPEVLKIKISGDSGSEAPSTIEPKRSAPTEVPLGTDGRPMERATMEDANLTAYFLGKPEPYTVEQVAGGRVLTPAEQMSKEAAEVLDEFTGLFEPKQA